MLWVYDCVLGVRCVHCFICEVCHDYIQIVVVGHSIRNCDTRYVSFIMDIYGLYVSVWCLHSKRGDCAHSICLCVVVCIGDSGSVVCVCVLCVWV